MPAGSMGFELHGIAPQCKLRLDQRCPESRAAMEVACVAGGENENLLAAGMNKLGLHGN